MGRRRKHVRKPNQRRRTARPKLRKAATGGTDLREQLDRRTRELDDLLQQQIATSEVLGIIRRSPADAQPVFEAIVQSAARLCGTIFSFVYLYENDHLRAAATKNFTAAAANQISARQELREINRSYVGGRAFLDRATVHVPDVLEDPEYSREFALAGGWRAVLAVPLLHEGKSIGALSVGKAEPKAFSLQQIHLLQTFADQAVIAIENTRLLSELRESLQQQTATADVLKVISSSPGDLEPVFKAILESATQICQAGFGTLNLYEDNAFRSVALHNPPPQFATRLGQVIHPHPESGLAHVARTRRIAHIEDIRTQKPYLEGNQAVVELANFAGARTLLIVPMLRDGELLGVISIYRQEVRLFTDKQVELVQNFAAQAVIAIENTRLLSELRQRTDDLSESLEQQTATSEVLQVISSSPGELEPVFNAMLTNATRICEAKFGVLLRFDGSAFHTAAEVGVSPEFAKFLQQRGPFQPMAGSHLERVMRTKQVSYTVDYSAEGIDSPPVKFGGARSTVDVPMLKENELVGVFSIYRQEVRPFTDKQVELVKNFAAQAVIAIENTRLLNELRESLQQQTATSDVLKVISRSAFDLRAVLQTLVESAARLCDADKTNITRERNGAFYFAEAHGFSQKFMDHVKEIRIEAGRGSASGRALLEGRAVHIPDVTADPEYTLVEPQRLGEFRTILTVPMLRENVPIGVLALTRSEVRPFTDKQIELATTFADQAAIAIENVRLFESVEARTRELAASLEDLRTTQDRLVQTQKLALLGQLTAGIAHEIKNPLNFVNNFSGISAELIDELQDTLKGMPLDDKARTEINELTNTLKGNFDKVVHHGKRADAIVKNMLQHSREGSGEHRIVDINALVEESLNLAWHGARAETQGFEIKLKQSLDPSAGGADVFPQDIRRALLNMISNGFYAATRRRAETNGGDYEPMLTASTKNLGDRVEVRIRDNGTGMLPDVKEKMFNPFFTTKPAGEGTGLGLSISHDIIVKQHGGSIEVDTQPGEFTEIRVILSRVAVFV